MAQKKMYTEPRTEQSGILAMHNLLVGSGDLGISQTPADPGMDID